MKLWLMIIIALVLAAIAVMQLQEDSQLDLKAPEAYKLEVEHKKKNEIKKEAAKIINPPPVVKKETVKKKAEPVKTTIPKVESKSDAPQPYQTDKGTFLKRGYLGIAPGGRNWASKAMKKYFDLDHFAYVGSVDDNSPAQIAGLKQHDLIIAIDEMEVKGFTQMNQLLKSKYTPGQLVEIKYISESSVQNTQLTLSTQINDRENSIYTGIREATMNAVDVLKTQFRIPDEGGYQVGIFQDQSPAPAAGIQLLDVILSIDSTPLTVENYQDVLAQYHPGDAVVISLFRKSGRLEIPVILGEKIVRVKEDQQKEK